MKRDSSPMATPVPSTAVKGNMLRRAKEAGCEWVTTTSFTVWCFQLAFEKKIFIEAAVGKFAHFTLFWERYYGLAFAN